MGSFKRAFFVLAVLFVFAGIAMTGCSVASDGKFAAAVENPFPWAESRPAPATTGG